MTPLTFRKLLPCLSQKSLLDSNYKTVTFVAPQSKSNTSVPQPSAVPLSLSHPHLTCSAAVWHGFWSLAALPPPCSSLSRTAWGDGASRDNPTTTLLLTWPRLHELFYLRSSVYLFIMLNLPQQASTTELHPAPSLFPYSTGDSTQGLTQVLCY
jgi:hypothetical protein